ncbi:MULTISPECIES: hypothetical protein [Frankia]|uniref:Secreted protein n=1 Tax=Frankia alni (strain DSM 45986 / CECT 9034 / ACN14a) TaxID=326424 RepID=Q0RIZ1_FRAAA|nr:MULTISPECIES: hypothetical protein [Frankia]CAJ62524.1 hypothetical protein; putative signal peptide [Frankia alni ACN14a]
MSRRFALPVRRLGALFTAAALAVGLTATLGLTAPAAQASTCTDNPYQGTWKATDPDDHLIVVALEFPNCSNWNSVKVSVLSHAFLGLSANSSYWGYASSVKWGVYGTSLTATYNFQGLTETLYITPSTRYTGLPIVETERYADGTSYTFPTQYFARA